MNVFHKVGEHKHCQLLLPLGGMHVRQQALVLHVLCRGTGALGAGLGVRFSRTDGRVIVVPWTRSGDVLLQLIRPLVEVGAQGGQRSTACALLNRGSGLWRQEVVGHVPGDPLPFGAQRPDISAGTAQQQDCNDECGDVDRADRCLHGFFPE